MTRCAYCGGEFEKTHNRQVYCSKRCAKYAKEEQDLHHKLKWYYKNKERLEETRLGTHNLSPHPNEDPEKEEQIIKHELRRLRLKYTS